MRLVLAFAMLAGGALAAVWMLPDDTDNARATSPEMLAAFADPPGKGVLDGLRFDTEMGVQGKPAELKDFVQFDQGLFMSQECTDRCNYPPSAYFTRRSDAGISFVVEAFRPTKDTTMVWRGLVDGNMVRGTVAWTTNRFYWSRTQVLEFSGGLSSEAVDLVPG